MRTLRKVLRVFEMRDGRGQGDEAHMYEDTVRVLRLLAEPVQHTPKSFCEVIFGRVETVFTSSITIPFIRLMKWVEDSRLT